MGTARYYPLGVVSPQFPKPLNTRSVAYLAAGVALFCAASVFFLLCERDHSFLSRFNQPESQNMAIQVAPPAPLVLTPSPVVAQTVPPPAVKRSAQREQEHISFNLTRSSHFQRVGPVQVGLWRTNLKHNSYDLSIVVAGRRFNQKNVSLDEPIWIRANDRTRPLELVVKGMRKNEVTGYLSAPADLAR